MKAVRSFKKDSNCINYHFLDHNGELTGGTSLQKTESFCAGVLTTVSSVFVRRAAVSGPPINASPGVAGQFPVRRASDRANQSGGTGQRRSESVELRHLFLLSYIFIMARFKRPALQLIYLVGIFRTFVQFYIINWRMKSEYCSIKSI